MEYRTTILMTQFVTHDVKRIVVERPEGFRFEPGQGVELAVDRDGWREEGRPFTPTSLVDDGVLEFTIKGYPEHQGVTREIHRLQAGDRLLMSSPFGTISYKGPGTFIAGGAGITPFLSILRTLHRRDELEGNSLIFSNKSPADIIGEKELKQLLGKQAHFLCSQQEDCHCQTGRVDKALLRSSISDFSQRFYVCGPPPMVESVNEALSELGASPETVVFER